MAEPKMTKPDMKYTAKYTMACGKNEYQLTFLCALCGYHYTTGVIYAGSEEEAKLLTEKEARKFFNGCRRCGKWVCDEHYNMSEMMCVECAPLAGRNNNDKEGITI